MYEVKQSTALDILFFAHDVNGDAVTGIADGGFTKNISKNAAAFAAMTVTIAERAGGWYLLPLSTVHTDTLGVLTVYLTSTAKQVNLQFRVAARIADDLATPTNITAGTLTTVTNLTNLPAITANWLTAAGINAAAITAAKFAAGAIDAAALAADAATEIAAAVWDRDATLSQTLGTFGQAIGDPVADTNTIYKGVVTDATGATVGVDVVAIKAETVTILADTDNIQTRLPAALVVGRIDASVGAMAADTITASAMAVGAIAADAFVAGAIDNAAFNVTETLTANPATGGIVAASFAAGAIDAAAIATDAIGSAEFSQAAADKVFGASGATLAELAQAAPSATPRPDQAMMLLYMALRNKLDVTATTKNVSNDAGTVIAKKALTDDGTTYSEAEMVTGP
jgi:hypothetical protein